MCNNCIHKPVCSIYRATGGNVEACEHLLVQKGFSASFPANSAMGTITIDGKEHNVYLANVESNPVAVQRKNNANTVCFKHKFTLIEC